MFSPNIQNPLPKISKWGWQNQVKMAEGWGLSPSVSFEVSKHITNYDQEYNSRPLDANGATRT
jgi:hypothetical protein